MAKVLIVEDEEHLLTAMAYVLRKAGALYESPLLAMYRTDAEALQAFEALQRPPL